MFVVTGKVFEKKYVVRIERTGARNVASGVYYDVIFSATERKIEQASVFWCWYLPLWRENNSGL